MSHWKELKIARLRSFFCSTSSNLISAPVRTWSNAQVFLTTPLGKGNLDSCLQGDENPRLPELSGTMAWVVDFIGCVEIFPSSVRIMRWVFKESDNGDGEFDRFLFRASRSCSILLLSIPKKLVLVHGADGDPLLEFFGTLFFLTSVSLSRLMTSWWFSSCNERAIASFTSSSSEQDILASFLDQELTVRILRHPYTHCKVSKREQLWATVADLRDAISYLRAVERVIFEVPVEYSVPKIILARLVQFWVQSGRRYC